MGKKRLKCCEELMQPKRSPAYMTAGVNSVRRRVLKKQADQGTVSHGSVSAGALLQLQERYGNRETIRLLHSIHSQPLSKPRVISSSSAPVQKMDDPDESIWKKFRDCAYVVGITKYYVKKQTIQKIIKEAANEGGAWNKWVEYCISVSGDSGVYLPLETIRSRMKSKKTEIEDLNSKITLKLKDVPKKEASWEDEEMPPVLDDIKPWMQTPTRDEAYETMLKEHYEKIQYLTAEAMDELHVEQGLLEKKKMRRKRWFRQGRG